MGQDAALKRRSLKRTRTQAVRVVRERREERKRKVGEGRVGEVKVGVKISTERVRETQEGRRTLEDGEGERRREAYKDAVERGGKVQERAGKAAREVKERRGERGATKSA